MFRAARTVVLLSILVQVAAFLRTAIIAAIFGASLTVDAYNLGVVAPTLLATVINGWLQVGFVERYAGLVATGEAAAASAYRTQMFLTVLVISVVATLLCVLQPDRLMALFLPAEQHKIAAASADALRVTGWILLPMIVGDFLGFLLNSHGRFFAAAAAPLLNAAVSVALLLLWSEPGLFALTVTLLVGISVQFLVVALPIALMRLEFSININGAWDEMRATLWAALPLLSAQVLVNLASAIVQFRSAQLGEGAVSIFGYAIGLHGAVSQVMVIGLGTVLLPHFGSLWARHQKTQIVVLLRRLTRMSVLLSACIGIGIWLFGRSVVTLLFKRGVFDSELAGSVSRLWAVLSISLLPFAVGTFIAKFCQALRGSFVILVSSAISFAVNWSVSYVGVQLGSLSVIVFSLTAAFSAATIFWVCWLYWIVPAKGLGMDIVGGALRSAAIFLPAAAIDSAVSAHFDQLPLFWSVFFHGMLFMTVAAGAIFAFDFWRWFLGQDLSAK